MKHIMAAWILLVLILAMAPTAATAALSYGTPADTGIGGSNPTPSPLFGTLVDFDDKAGGTAVGQYDYLSLGVASIIEIEGLGAFARYGTGTQSKPNYVGTGSTGERGTDAPGGWDGTIQIDLALPANMVGIGISNSIGSSETINIYDSGGSLLESHLATGINVYAVITRGAYDISRLEIIGDFFAIDDLQFNSIPAPSAILLAGIGVGLVGCLRGRGTL